MSDTLTIAREAALAGGMVLRDRAGLLGEVRGKRWVTDLVTETDVLSGVAIAHEIARILPDARFVIEEDEVYALAGVTRGDLSDPEVWVVDPLDGTTSYVHSYPCYSTSVALLREGRPVAGAVYHVGLDRLYSAALDRGAFANDERLAVRGSADVQTSLLITGFPYDRGRPLDIQLDILARFLRAPVHGIRRDGSAAIDCCQVADNRADGFWEFSLQPWDTAAGVIILNEAGALITDIDGSPWSVHVKGVCAANATLHPLMLEIINSAMSAHTDPTS